MMFIIHSKKPFANRAATEIDGLFTDDDYSVTMLEWLKDTHTSIEWAGRCRVGANWNSWRYHADPFHRLYFIFSGKARGHLEDKPLLLRPGHYYLFPAGARLFLNRPEKEMDHLWVHFQCRVLAGLNIFHLVTTPLSIAEKHIPYLTPNLLPGLSDYDQNKNDGGLHLHIKGFLYSVISQFLRRGTMRGNTRAIQDMEKYRPVFDYIESHLHQPVMTSELAGLMNQNATYFANCFRERFGLAPKDYLIRRRLTRSQEALLHSELPVKAIAGAAGYSDPFFFSRLFKKHMGVSPRTYRQQKRMLLP